MHSSGAWKSGVKFCRAFDVLVWHTGLCSGCYWRLFLQTLFAELNAYIAYPNTRSNALHLLTLVAKRQVLRSRATLVEGSLNIIAKWRQRKLGRIALWGVVP